MLSGLAGSTAALAFMTSSVSASSERQELFDQYRTVINVVDEGADPNAAGAQHTSRNNSVNPIIENFKTDDTLLYFPEGRYYFDQEFRFVNFENFGLYGPDADIVPADYHNFNRPRNHRLFNLGIPAAPGNGLHFEGFDIDWRADGTGLRLIDADVTDDLLVRDIDFVGTHDSGTWGPGRFAIRDPSGSGLVERFRAPHGGEYNKYTPHAGNHWVGPTGIISNDYNAGTLTYRDCVLGGFPDNGLYAKGGSGSIRVRGGHYRNSNVAQIRIGGYDSSIKGATLEVDTNRPDDQRQNAVRVQDGGIVQIEDTTMNLASANGEAVLIQNGEYTEIRDCDIRVDGNIVADAISTRRSTEQVIVSDTDIRMNTDGGFAVFLRETSAANPRRAVLTNVTVRGDVGSENHTSAFRLNRDGAEVRSCSVRTNGDSRRRGVEIVASDTLVHQSTLMTPDYPVLAHGADPLIMGSYLRSDRGQEGLRIDSVANGTRVLNNRIYNGVDDRNGSTEFDRNAYL
ncbi:right-handed parallel beta-helix repeat-containing protein [Natrononativus amylolyticus]|uniref:right-handed parallel beta-helix repeat-containing protein n=1 Tax=Natrononativus amylolyticus TaxID=2963434 RepID=UPI0020CE6D36|nr:right-handed parallel beta-helix repeat-containing protein [Natrononativus amylolyticus]